MKFLRWLIPVDESEKKTPNIPLLIKGYEQKRKTVRKLSQLGDPKYDLGKAFEKLKQNL